MALPQLRFKGFTAEWSKKKLESFLERVSKPVDVVDDQEYVQIGIRSHGKGIFHKEPVTGKELGNKRVFWIVPNALVVNIVFAWERAIAVTSENENGLIASHRFPMYLPKNNLSNVDFLRYMFLTDKGQSYLELASPGGAGRNKTLGQSNFAELKIDLPDVEEQTKIASFLSVVDEKITQLKQKHELLSQYKQGMTQKLFSQQIRFKADDGGDFGEWEEKLLSEIGTFKNGLNKDKESFGFGFPFVNLMDVFGKQIVRTDRLGLVDATDRDLENYSLKKGDVLFIRSSVKAEGVGQTVLVDKDLKNVVYSGFLIRFRDSYGLDLGFKKYCFMNNTFRLKLLAKSTTSANTNINQESLYELSIDIPCLEEQIKIANFLSAIDQKIEKVAQQIEETKHWKKGLLQQIFV